MLLINWTADFRWRPKLLARRAPWFVSLSWFWFQVTLYSYEMAEAAIDYFNEHVKKDAKEAGV